MTLAGLAAGLLLPAIVALLGWIAVAGRSAAEGAAGLRELGVLMTLVSGVFSAIWWHQSADLAGRETEDPAVKGQANTLNGAAATLTALALIAGIFCELAPWDWDSLLAAGAFLLLLGTSGAEIVRAAALCFRQRLRLRTVLGLVILILAAGLFIGRHVAV